jgi:hypothetical protein
MGWSGSESIATLYITPDKGKWVDWVFHVKWSWHDDGLVEVWKDGDLVGAKKGPNCANDVKGPQTAFGVYKWPWKVNGPGSGSCLSSLVERLIYVDEFRVGGAKSKYNEVAPGDKLPSPQPSPTSTPTPRPSFNLSSGWNQVSWISGLPSYTAKSSLEDINQDCGSGTGLIIARKTKDFWEEYLVGYGGLNFNLQDGGNYFLKLSKNCTWTP